MRRFHLHRDNDISGVSGVGCVAQGIEFDDGRIVLMWLRPPYAMSTFATIDDLRSVHGHQGTTTIVWQDGA